MGAAVHVTDVICTEAEAGVRNAAISIGPKQFLCSCRDNVARAQRTALRHRASVEQGSKYRRSRNIPTTVKSRTGIITRSAIEPSWYCCPPDSVWEQVVGRGRSSANAIIDSVFLRGTRSWRAVVALRLARSDPPCIAPYDDRSSEERLRVSRVSILPRSQRRACDELKCSLLPSRDSGRPAESSLVSIRHLL
jgi:hypothetical protein